MSGRSGSTSTRGHRARLDFNISYGYDDANRKKRETVTTKSYGLNVTRAVLYDYDPDGNRSRLTYPQGNQYIYAYTERNELDTIKLDPALFGAQPALVNYAYDNRGNRTSRVGPGGAHSEYEIDELNRIEGQTNYFSGGKTIRFDYGFDALGRRRYEQRDHAAADGYQYDPADEVTFYRRGGSLNGDGSVSGGSTVVDFDPYDGNGNKTGVRTNGKLDTHVHNNLNQYESTTALGALGYDLKGNLTKLQGWAYTYDAQNRLIALDHVALNVHIRQHYDPLNRMIARDNNGVITSYVWDNWNLLEERKGTGAIKRCYVYGAGQNELVQAYEGGVYAKLWYWQDGRGNTAAVSGEAGFLAERYRYDLTGTPSFYDANNFAQASANDTRFLFAGSLYQPETGLYDMRNRFYHVTLSRFLQTDPIGFKGDALNLYRYCENDFVDRSDPDGLYTSAVGTGTLASHPKPPIQPDWQWEFAKFSDSSNRSQGTMRDTIDKLSLMGGPVNFNISSGRAPIQNWNRDIHATAFSGGNDPTDSTNPAFLDRRLRPDESAASLPGGGEMRGKSIDVVYTRTGARQDGIPVVDKGPFFDGTPKRPADRYWNSGARPLAESTRANKSGLDLSPQAWRNFGFGIRHDSQGVPFPVSRFDRDPTFDWRWH